MEKEPRDMDLKRRKTDLVFQGCAMFRQRVVCSILSGKTVRIDEIRSDEEQPGLTGRFVSPLRSGVLSLCRSTGHRFGSQCPQTNRQNNEWHRHRNQRNGFASSLGYLLFWCVQSPGPLHFPRHTASPGARSADGRRRPRTRLSPVALPRLLSRSPRFTRALCTRRHAHDAHGCHPRRPRPLRTPPTTTTPPPITPLPTTPPPTTPPPTTPPKPLSSLCLSSYIHFTARRFSRVSFSLAGRHVPCSHHSSDEAIRH